MSRIIRTRGQWLLATAAVSVGALATYVAAAQPPAGRGQTTASTITTKSVRQPIGTPRVTLDAAKITRLPKSPSMPGVCAAPVDVNIAVNPPSTGGKTGASLNMRTEDKAVWYSLVDTIPPVGHTASITVNPVRLLEGDRKVGTLISGEVKFREVVRDIPLAGTDAENDAKVSALLQDFGSFNEARLAKLSSIKVPQYVVPGPGIQVMRAQLEETYEIDGIGKDTVQLHGWIAVRHGPARPVKGETEVTWDTAVLDTEFVGMDLRGDSDTFGKVVVTLDATRPSHGQVGRIEIPELARFALLAKLKKETLAENASPAPAASTTEKKR